MSKGNLFLGFGRGKLGDVVFTRTNGEQVARARNRSPRNPQTPLQLLQRVVMKTSSTAFSLMQAIVDHSFAGYDGVTANQSQFVRRNIDLLRTKLSEEINSGDDDVIMTSSKANFAARATVGAEINPYVVSGGSITPLFVEWSDENSFFEARFTGTAIPLSEASPSYAAVVAALGLQQGDQLTFIQMTCDDTEAGASGQFNGFYYARVILEPSDGDMTKAFLGTAGAINDPNPRNEGVVTISLDGRTAQTNYYGLAWSIRGGGNWNAGVANAVCASTVIASRYVGSVWQRSEQSLVLRPDTIGGTSHLSWDHQSDLLSDAILSYMSGESSSLYLNQAESF